MKTEADNIVNEIREIKRDGYSLTNHRALCREE